MIFEYITLDEVAKKLNLPNRSAAYFLLRSNKFPGAIKKNGKWLVPKVDIETHKEYMNKENNKLKNCLNMKEVAKELGYKSTRSVLDLIQNSHLPNSTKYKGIWLVPISDIKAYKENTIKHLDTEQVRNRLNLSTTHHINTLIDRNIFPNAFKDLLGRWRIPIEDVLQYESSLCNDHVGTSEAAKLLDFTSTKGIIELINKDLLPNAYKYLGKWRIHLEDIEDYKRVYRPAGHLDSKQVAERLGYKSSTSIIEMISKSFFPNAMQIQNKWWIPICDIKRIEDVYAKSLGTKEIATELDLVSSREAARLIRNNEFPNAFKDMKNKWRVPLSDVENYAEKKNDANSIGVVEAAKRLNCHRSSLIEYVNKDYFPNAYRFSNSYKIPLKDIEDFKKIQPELKKRRKRITSYPEVEHCLDVIEASNVIGTKKCNINYYISVGKFPTAFKFKSKWWIPKYEVERYLESKEYGELLKKKYLTVSELAVRLNYSRKNSLSNAINDGKFPNAFKYNGEWRIPEEDILAFEKEIFKRNQKISFTPEWCINEMKNFLNSYKIKKELMLTKKLFKSFCIIQLNAMEGSNSYKKNRFLQYKSFYKRLNHLINKELFTLSSKEIGEMLEEDSPLKNHQKRIFLMFLDFCYIQNNIEPEHRFTVSSRRNRNSKKEIYSPELFKELFQYVNLLEMHRERALKDRAYANMWVYVILLLTDFIRGQDLILHTPNLDLEALGIDSLDWFYENNISQYQAQSIINQLYMHFRQKRTSKTSELLTFIVAPDFLLPLATSLAISELHRRLEKSQIILGTFIIGKYDTIQTSGKKSHLKFFDKFNRQFDFKSQKMNRSVATYLFHSVSEGEGNDSELALYLTQVSRSHKNPDTTSQYIQVTNRDGPIDRVSYNLFKRGHFGWLYNSLILYASKFKGLGNGLEERSALIEQIREEINPRDLEVSAGFVESSLKLSTFDKNHTEKMQDFLDMIYRRRQSIVSRLISNSPEEIKSLISKLSQGELPSKSEHAQCLVYPNCTNPRLKNCYSCENVIPGRLILIQLNEEIDRVVKSIKNTNNKIIVEKETRFLMHALFIWKEAQNQYGLDIVEAFISKKDKWDSIEDIADKINIK